MIFADSELMENQPAVFARLLGKDIVAMKPLQGGRNSRVFCLVCPDRCFYAGKVYMADPDDCRDRLRTEFRALSFLWECGERSIPKPIAMCRQSSSAVYEFVRGTTPTLAVNEAAIDSAVAFLGRLKDYGKRGGGSSFIGDASEACFSGADIATNVTFRLQRMWTLTDCGEATDMVQAFLQDDFSPFWDEVQQWHREKLNESGKDFDESLSSAQRTLSPSDFGFHNCLFTEDRQRKIVFLDFEYFGWDDPAKMIADFLLHPGMSLPVHLKRQFFARITTSFSDCPQLADRVESVYPLHGLKWCLILLNECLSTGMKRRRFAAGSWKQPGCPEQLCKARQLLHKIKGDFRKFPYGEN
ncbi:MAG: aminoglycoside phosphotransferase family protein [Desulfobulbaceae bacterium]|nr:aminoglycoside phosphotransferase family protein [Pseudomonadota bacterium]MCG2748443.1 aminoglycoside phosphotransferase family protein [Desulfobulbaceae bacterium]